MRTFAFHRAASAEEAVRLVAGQAGAKYLAGGTNLVDLMKLEIETPDHLVQLRGVSSTAVEALGEGRVRLGAGARNSDVSADPAVRDGFGVLAQALVAGASAQVRNAATVGGNVLQRTRCPYFAQPATACNKRAPGSGCAARDGLHRQHAVLGGSRECISVHPSDMAVALAALDATVHILGTDGPRTIPFDRLHRLPGADPARETRLEHADLITAIDLEPLPAGARSAYRKVRDRRSFAFALISVAAVLVVDDGRVTHAAIALGGVAPVPWRARQAEAALIGAVPRREVFAAALDAELAAAEPLPQNAFKLPLVRNTATQLLAELADVA